MEDKNKKKMVILRGVSGSGKTHYALQYAEKNGMDRRNMRDWHVSADSYFVEPEPTEDGHYEWTYRFDPSKLGEAHCDCFRRAIYLVRRGTPCVVVDNTNTTAAEIAPYYLLGESYGYDVEIVLVWPPSNEIAAARNCHGVSIERIRDMSRAILTEKLPPWWKQTVVQSA